MIENSVVYALEYSEKAKADGMFCYHVRKLFDGRHINHFYDTDAHGWRIIFVGTDADCYQKMDAMLERPAQALVMVDS